MFSNRDLKKMIFPLVGEQILVILVGMLDTAMVSYAGEAAVSGVSLTDMLNYLFMTVFAAIATGGAVIVSQYLGGQDIGKARDFGTAFFDIWHFFPWMRSYLSVIQPAHSSAAFRSD